MDIKTYCFGCKNTVRLGRIKIEITDLKCIIHSTCSICGRVRTDELDKNSAEKIQNIIQESKVEETIQV